MINGIITRIFIVGKCPDYPMNLIIFAANANIAPLSLLEVSGDCPSSASPLSLFPSKPSARCFVYS
jgi:hypothetical protein